MKFTLGLLTMYAAVFSFFLLLGVKPDASTAIGWAREIVAGLWWC